VKRLGLDLRRVKRAIKSLDGKYFKIARTHGAVNYYTPIWVSSAGIKSDDELGLSDPCLDVSSDKKHPGGGDKKHPGGGDKKHPVSPSRILSNLPSRAGHDHTKASSSREAVGNQDEKSESLTGHRDDGTVELKAIELFDKVGLDGFEIVSSLHEIDDGLPRLRLFRLIRGGAVTGNDLHAVALAVLEHESRKKPRISIAKRTQGGSA
jgi:hypothetical protein